MQKYHHQKTIEYLGRKFGRLTVIEILPRDKNRHIRLRCECECGKLHDVLASNLRRKLTTSCGCLKREKAAIRLTAYLESDRRQKEIREKVESYRNKFVGKRFNRLTVTNPGKTLKTVECICDCGKSITTYYSNLLNGHTKSCGCLLIYRHPEKNVGLRKLYYRYSFRSKRLHGEKFPFTLDAFKALTSECCVYCGQSPNTVIKSKSEHSSYTYNGLDRIDTSKGYTVDNTVTCCEMCNRMKLDYSKEEFLNQVSRIWQHHRKS